MCEIHTLNVSYCLGPITHLLRRQAGPLLSSLSPRTTSSHSKLSNNNLLLSTVSKHSHTDETFSFEASTYSQLTMATVNMSYPRVIRLTIKSKVPSTKPMPEGSRTLKRSSRENNEVSPPTKKLKIIPPPETVSFKDSFKGPLMVTVTLPSHVLQAEAEQAPHRKQRRDLIKQG